MILIKILNLSFTIMNLKLKLNRIDFEITANVLKCQ